MRADVTTQVAESGLTRRAVESYRRGVLPQAQACPGRARPVDRIWEVVAGVPLWARIGVAACAGGVLFVASGAGPAVAAGLICMVGPQMVRDLRERRRLRELEAQLAGAAELLARRLSTGSSLRQGFRVVADAVPDPLGAELKAVRAAIELGATPEDAFAERMADLDGEPFRLAVHALSVHARSGGPVIATLRRLARIVRERRAADLEVAALTAQGRLSGLVVAIAPVALSLFTRGMGRAAMPFWASVAVELTGWFLVACGLLVIWRMTSPDAAAVMAVRRTRTRRSGSRWPAGILMMIGKRVPVALTGEARTRRLLGGLVAAEPSPGRLHEIAGTRVVLSMAGVLVGGLAGFGSLGIALAVGLGAAGWLVVEWPWRRRLAADRAALEAQIPYACDLLVLSLGAGTNLHQAVVRAADQIEGPLGARLRRVRDLLAVGESLDDALMDVAAPSGSDDLDEVVASILEARRRGGALVAVLDDLAADMRHRERLRRQARARKLPVKVVFPLVFCILPAFVLLGVVPLVVSAVASLQL